MSYDNFVFVFNAKDSIGGLWKGEYAEEFDEIFIKEIIEKISEKFGELDIRILDTLDREKGDDDVIKFLKMEILKNLPNKTLWKIKRAISSIFTPGKIKRKKIKEESLEILSDQETDLGIPEVPIAPPKQVVKLDSPKISPKLLEKVTKGETEKIKYVLVKCDRCNEIIAVPIPKNKILDSELPIVPISYVHSKGNDEHCLTVHIDHDFDVRRRRISDIMYEE